MLEDKHASFVRGNGNKCETSIAYGTKKNHLIWGKND